MKLQGQHTFDVPRDRVWEALLDPEVLRNTLPGCEDLKEVGEHQFEGALNIKVGPVQGQFNGSVELYDLVPPESYRLKMKGQGAQGFVQGEGSLRLEAEGDKTVVHYDVDAQVGGRIAGVGQRLLDSSARVITRQALEGLGAQLERREGGEGEAAAPAPAPPSQVEFAAKVAKGVAADLVPPSMRPWLVAGGLVILVVVIFLIVRACGG